MWFTRVSLQNPVFATMVMLAIVVLGLFSYQRLKVDQFPNIDFPVVVVTTEYPGASPEIVESEVTKKIEEGVNAIAGINALTSRSYEGQSVVIIEFSCTSTAARPPRTCARRWPPSARLLRTEVKEPRVLRFDPASRAIWSLAVLPDAARGARHERGGADQLGRPGAQEAAGERARRRLGHAGGRHQARDQHLPEPAGHGGLGITPTRWWPPCATRTRTCRWAPSARAQQERVVQIDARMQRPKTSARSSWRARTARRCAWTRWPAWSTAAGSRQPGAVQRPAHPAADGAEGPGREHHRGGRRPEENRGRDAGPAAARPAAGAHHRRLAPDPRVGGQRAPHADRRRAAHGADRVPVPELLALHRHHRADAADRHHRHLPVHEHVRLHHQHDHADGAEPVRGPADRRRHRGAREHRAPCADGQDALPGRAGRHAGDRPGGAGHHLVHRGGVPAHRLHGRHHRQVLPRVRHHHRGGGADLDVRQLHARPDAVQHLARPGIEAHGKPSAPRACTTRPSAASPAGSTAAPIAPGRRLPGHPALVAGAQAGHLDGAGRSSAQHRSWCRCWAPSSCPRPTFPKPPHLLHPGGFVAGSDRGQGAPGRGHRARMPEVRYTLSTINTGNAQGKIYASVYVRLVDRKDRSRSVDQMSACCASGCARCRASPSPTSACSTRWAATSRWSSRCRGPT
jgi:hypothetical protein